MRTGEGLRRAAWLLLICGACLGCQTAHVVTRYPDGGVIAIPEDTPELRAKAEKLMKEHLPLGYVVTDVRMIPLGHPYQTVVQVGPIAEVETHQRHEFLLTYHAPGTTASAPAPYPPPPPSVAQNTPPPVQRVSAPSLPDGLPAQPIPVGN